MNNTISPQTMVPPPPPPAPAPQQAPAAPTGDSFDKALGQARKTNKPKDPTPPAKDAKSTATQSTKSTDPNATSVDHAGAGTDANKQPADSKSNKDQSQSKANQDPTATQAQDDAQRQADSVQISGKTTDPKLATPPDANTTPATPKDPKAKSAAKPGDAPASDPSAQANAASAQASATPTPTTPSQNNPANGQTDAQASQATAAAAANAQSPRSATDQSPVNPDARNRAQSDNSSDQNSANLPLNPVADADSDSDFSISSDAKSADAAPTHANAGPSAPTALQGPQFSNILQSKTNPTQSVTVAAAPVPTAPPEAQFASANHGNIVSGIHGQLLPDGGTMHIRLDPPELGAVQVTVKMEHGALSASFQTNNDSATQMLSHSLGQLKQALESQGVSVDRLHVQQSPKQDASGNGSTSEDAGKQNPAQQRESQQDEQRREVLRRMWRRVAGGGDPLDLVA